MDGPTADAMFESVISAWLFDRLSNGTEEGENPVAVLSKFEPLKVVKDIFDLAKLKLAHPGAGTVPVDLSLRKDVDFVESVRAFRRWHTNYPKERSTGASIDEFETLAAFYKNCFETVPTFARLWELADPPRTPSMKWNEFTFTEPRNLGRWKSAYGKDNGPGLSQQADEHFRTCVTQFAELLGQIGDAMVGQISRALDPVTDLYTERKENAAVLDFDDLLQRAHALVTTNEVVRTAIVSALRISSLTNFRTPIRSRPVSCFRSRLAACPAGGRTPTFVMGRFSSSAIPSNPSTRSVVPISIATIRQSGPLAVSAMTASSISVPISAASQASSTT